MSSSLRIIVVGIAISVLAESAVAQAPRIMSFQGILTDDSDVPIDGTQTLIVKLFNDEAAGTELWTRTYTDHPVNGGIFDLLLKDGTPAFSTLTFDDTVWVEVRAGAEVLSPRAQLAASSSTLGLSLPIAATVEAPGVGVAAFQVTNTASPHGIGIQGLSSGTWGVGVRGWANGTSDSPSIGVSGETNSTGGYGVLGKSEMGGFGVVGFATGASATGVRGDGTAFGGRFRGGAGVFVAASDNAGDTDFFIRDAANGIIFQVDESGDVFADGIMVHSSDRNKKEGIEPVDTRLTLERLVALSISRWKFKGKDDVHVGPMAQDFYAAFDVGVDDTRIATIEADGVALAAIQGLYAILLEQQEEIEQLRNELHAVSNKSRVIKP